MFAPITQNVNPRKRDIVNARIFAIVAVQTDKIKLSAQARTVRMGSLAPIESCSKAAMLVSASWSWNQERDGGLTLLNDIKKDDVLQEYVGEVIDKRELDSGHDKSYAFFLRKGWFVDARQMGNETHFVNHSCKPNWFERRYIKGYTHVALCATKDIKAGEFLSCDYRWDSSKHCQCDSPNCKRTMNGQRERRRHGRPPSKGYSG